MNAPQAIIETIQLKDGREITIETGKLAKQANGSVVVRMGGTMLLATVVANKEASPGVDFLPLTVDYREKFYSGGRLLDQKPGEVSHAALCAQIPQHPGTEQQRRSDVPRRQKKALAHADLVVVLAQHA